jgi:protease I
MKKAVMIIPHQGFRDEELLDTKAVLEKNGVEVKVASNAYGPAKGKLGAQISPDLFYKDVRLEDFDAVIFVGGPGSIDYWNNAFAHKLINDSVALGKVTAGICSASVTLAKSGILKGKRATVFPGDFQELIENGANYTASHLEIDGNIITADGPYAAKDFGEAIVKALKK